MNGGLKVDDVIISIDEIPINKFGDIPRVIQEKKTNELPIWDTQKWELY